MSAGKFTHVSQLDGLRAIAIGIVFVSHCGLDKIVPGGLGVTIFFFLSGYLITSLLRSEAEQTGRLALSGFYLRRTLRIWPPLYITIALTWLGTRLMTPAAIVDPWAVAAQLGFVINYADLWGHSAGVPSLPLWSLAVEEHFYLVFPPLFALARHQPPRVLAAASLLLAMIVLFIRVISLHVVEDVELIYYWSHTRIDSILFGSCLALWQNPVLDEGAWKPRAWHALSALGVILLCLLIRNEEFRQTLRYTLQGCALFVLFSYAINSHGIVKTLLSSRPMKILALYSYTFYLIHKFMIDQIAEVHFGTSVVAKLVIGGSLTLVYCAAMFLLVEQPLARLRRSSHRVDRAVVA